MGGRLQVLVACSDPESRHSLASVLVQCGLEPVFTSTVSDAQAILTRQAIPLVFCAESLADGSFRDILRAVKTVASKIPVVVASRLDNTPEYLEAMGLGAFDFIACPYRRAEVEWIISKALRRAVAAA